MFGLGANRSEWGAGSAGAQASAIAASKGTITDILHETQAQAPHPRAARAFG
jgi:hypothetical protein